MASIVWCGNPTRLTHTHSLVHSLAYVKLCKWQIHVCILNAATAHCHAPFHMRLRLNFAQCPTAGRQLDSCRRHIIYFFFFWRLCLALEWSQLASCLLLTFRFECVKLLQQQIALSASSSAEALDADKEMELKSEGTEEEEWERERGERSEGLLMQMWQVHKPAYGKWLIYIDTLQKINAIWH